MISQNDNFSITFQNGDRRHLGFLKFHLGFFETSKF